MLSKKMAAALNKQIQEELFSSYLYLSMSAHFSGMGLDGFANWMSVQEKEERDHAMKIYNYMLSQGAKIKLLQLDEPQHEWKTPLEIFQAGLKHEKHITKCINDLVDIAEKEKDRATFNFLQWYVDEQVEEEENANNVIDKLKLIKDHPHGLFMLDKDMAARVYTPLIPAE